MPGVFERAGFSQKQRLMIFLTVCIPVRLSLVYITKKYNQSNILKFATLLFALLTIYNNSKSLYNKSNVIWDRRFHILTSIMIVISIISSNYKFVPYILLSDVIIGALKSVSYTHLTLPTIYSV